MVGYVIQTTVRRKNLLFCVREEPSFHTVINTSPFVVSRSSIHTVCDKLSERLCHLRKWLCHHLSLSFRRMPMRNGRLCHSDDCKEEESPLLCARRAFISHCHQHFSFRCFPFKYTYGLWQAIRTVVPPTEMIVPNLWNGCAKCLAQLCQRLVTVVPKAWHKHAKGVARARHTYKGTLIK